MKPVSNCATKSGSTDVCTRNIGTDRELNELYIKVLEFDIDGKPVEFSFSQRLARENGWCGEYTQQVVVEYKRFLFLAVSVDHPVTPSSPVDKAWHLHLTYTSSYWDKLCSDILGRPVHHHPTQGGPDEIRKYRCQYLQTLASYESMFGTPPNPNIWPRLQDRFAESAHPPRINKIRSWLARKSVKGNPTQIKRTALSRGVAAAALILFPIYLANAQDSSDSFPVRYLWLMIILAAVAYLMLKYVFKLIFRNKCPACGRIWALERTGAKREQKGGFWNTDLEEWCCKHCGHRNWEKEPSCGG